MSGQFGRLLLLGLAGLLLGGCNKNLKEQNEALYAENQELRSELTNARDALDLCETERAQMANTIDSLEAQLDEAQSAPASGRSGFEGIEGIEVEQGRRGEVTVRVPGDVLFASGKVNLRNSSKRTLQQIAGVLQSDYPNGSIRVEGYTDSDPIRKSDWKDNLELSLQRAAAVERYLSSQGVGSERIYSAGFGEANPRASNSNPEGKAKNRRVEIVVVR